MRRYYRQERERQPSKTYFLEKRKWDSSLIKENIIRWAFFELRTSKLEYYLTKCTFYWYLHRQSVQQIAVFLSESIHKRISDAMPRLRISNFGQ